MKQKIELIKKSSKIIYWEDYTVCILLSFIFSVGLIMMIALVLQTDVCTWNKYGTGFLVILFSLFIYKVLRKRIIDK